jgi:hypothetical protein
MRVLPGVPVQLKARHGRFHVKRDRMGQQEMVQAPDSSLPACAPWRVAAAPCGKLWTNHRTSQAAKAWFECRSLRGGQPSRLIIRFT